jgi:signal transduction histidine kinase
MKPRLAARIARYVQIVLAGAGISHLIIALLLVFISTGMIRGRLELDGLRGLRLAAEAGRLSPSSLRVELGDLSKHVIATYNERGELIATNRDDVAVPRTISSLTRATAGAALDRIAFTDDGPFYAREHGAVIATRSGPVAFVGVFDRWAVSAVGRALLLGLLGGFFLSVAIGQLAAIWLARRVVRELNGVQAIVHRMASGELFVRLPVTSADEIGELAADFNAMANSLEGTVRSLEKEREARRRRFADWTHEVATPLSSVLAYLESLQMDLFDQATRQRHLAIVYERALALKALTDDLATLSQAELEGLRIERVPVDVVETARAEIAALAPQAQAAGIRVTLSAKEVPPVEGDRIRLGQVLRNVLGNAIRYASPSGQVAVDIRRAENGAATIDIIDDGQGIAPEHLAHLSEPFYRVDRSRDRSTGGRGLGLAIAKSIIEAHGGSLTFRSVVGKGTAVTVALAQASDSRAGK